MKRFACALAATLLFAGTASLAYALPGHHAAFPVVQPPLASAANTTYPIAPLSDTSTLVTASSDQLWTAFAQAEAYKKLYELQEKALREQLHLYEGPGAAYSLYAAGDSQAYSQWAQLKEQEYALKIQKEQAQWQKKQAETSLKLLGEKPDKAQLLYALYAGTCAPSGLDYQQLLTQRYTLQIQEQQLELEKKTLEYQYQLGQVNDDDFVAQFSAAVQQKERIKAQREQAEAEIQLLDAATSPGLAAPLLP